MIDLALCMRELKDSPGRTIYGSSSGQEQTIATDTEIPSSSDIWRERAERNRYMYERAEKYPMRIKREIRIFLRVLRVAISSPMNLITCAIVAGIFFMIATAPMPSKVYVGDKLREALAAAIILFIPLFGLYLLIRSAVAIFGKWRKALVFAGALWALLMPIVIGIITNNRYGYRDDDAKHALVAKIHKLELKPLPSSKTDEIKLIDLGRSSALSLLILGVSAGWSIRKSRTSPDDLDIAQDVGKWHPDQI